MNPVRPMNQNNDDDEERQPTVFKIDEETDVHFLEQEYPLNYFRRRYRMRRKLFLKIVKGISTYEADPLFDHFNFFRVRSDATGRMSLSVIMKCTTTIRQLAYGTTPDAFDKYLQMITKSQMVRGSKGIRDAMRKLSSMLEVMAEGNAGYHGYTNLVFQLVDDVLDFTSTSSSLGKGSVSHIRHACVQQNPKATFNNGGSTRQNPSKIKLTR
nr:putative nuclease HARBI1 [Tanacetum cinerariifolium]